MEWMFFAAMLAMLATAAMNLKAKSQVPKAITGRAAAPVKAIEAHKSAHQLVRTWLYSNHEGQLPPGWRWKCSCGVWGLASDITQSGKTYNLGSEGKAINGFKYHAAQYREVNGDAYKQKWEESETEFAEYRNLCYCKETNDSLLPWKDR